MTLQANMSQNEVEGFALHGTIHGKTERAAPEERVASLPQMKTWQVKHINVLHSIQSDRKTHLFTTQVRIRHNKYVTKYEISIIEGKAACETY